MTSSANLRLGNTKKRSMPNISGFSAKKKVKEIKMTLNKNDSTLVLK